MSEQRDNGGFAFPSSEQFGFREADYGMTMRDWFAGQALESIMQDRAIWDCTPEEREDIADRMYAWSDAMLKSRSKP